MASAYLLQELHAASCELDITLIGEEEDCCYNRVLLSSVLAGEKESAELPMLSVEVMKNVSLKAGERVERIDTDRRVVVTHRGSQYAYDKLVLATGSQVALPKLADMHVEGIEVFRSLEDTEHLKSLDSTNRSAVVVGGGLLGLEAAHGLNAQGFATTVVHRNHHLMNRQLDAAGAAFLQASLAQKGIGFELGCEISELHHSDRKLTAISLTNGDYLACDLLLFATGIVPNTALARASGIGVDRGVLVNAALQTQTAGVFALGECSQIGSECFGLVAPIRAQAAVLASRLAGSTDEEYVREDWPTQLKISGIEIFRAGVIDEQAENIELNAPSQGIYRRLLVKNDRLIGAVLVGDKRHGAWYSELIRDKADIGALRATLMFGPQEHPPSLIEELAA